MSWQTRTLLLFIDNFIDAGTGVSEKRKKKIKLTVCAVDMRAGPSGDAAANQITARPLGHVVWPIRSEWLEKRGAYRNAVMEMSHEEEK